VIESQIGFTVAELLGILGGVRTGRSSSGCKCLKKNLFEEKMVMLSGKKNMALNRASDSVPNRASCLWS